jgi:hypothetical protein
MAGYQCERDKEFSQLAFELAMEIFEISKELFPRRRNSYSLTDQIRKSYQKCMYLLIEAYRKKQYPAHVVSKVSDSEHGGTLKHQDGLILPLACKYITVQKHQDLISKKFRNWENC